MGLQYSKKNVSKDTIIENEGKTNEKKADEGPTQQVANIEKDMLKMFFFFFIMVTLILYIYFFFSHSSYFLFIVEIDGNGNLFPVTYHWVYGGKEVYLSGSFNDWESKVPMNLR